MTQPPTLDANHDGKVTTSEAYRWAAHWLVHGLGALVTAYITAATYGLVPMPALPTQQPWTPCPAAAPSPVAAPADTDAPPAPPVKADTDAAPTAG